MKRLSLHRTLKRAAALAALAAALLPASLHALVPPEVFNEKAEKSKIKAVASVVDVKAVEEKDGVERRLVTFKLEKRVGEAQVPEEFVASCSSLVKGKPKSLGDVLYFNPVKGERFYVTVAEKDNEMTSLTPMSPRLMNALVKTPDKVKFNIGLATVDDGADQHIDKGEEALRKKDFRQAISEANKAVQICSTYDRAFHLRGRIFMETEKYDSAEEDFNKAISLNPAFLDAFFQRGICKVNQGRATAGIEDFDKVIQADPKDLQALYCRASALKYSGQLDKALEDFKRIEEADKSNHAVSRQIAFIQYEKGSMDKAEAQFKRTFELNPQDMYSAIFLHIAGAKQGRKTEIAAAAASFKDPSIWPAPVVMLLAGSASPEKCLELAASGKPADNQWRVAGAYFYIGEKALLDGDKAKAAASFAKCIEAKDVKSQEYGYAKKELEALRK